MRLRCPGGTVAKSCHELFSSSHLCSSIKETPEFQGAQTYCQKQKCGSCAFMSLWNHIVIR